MAQVQLVKDVNTVSTGPGTTAPPPAKLTNVNGTLFFVAYDAEHGEELWKSDGTEAGTVLVKDVKAGPGNSGLSWLTNVDGTLFFIGTDTHGLGLWKSDGTEAGTILVKGLGLQNNTNFNLTSLNGILFFALFNTNKGQELWKSNGTAAGTMLLKDINPGTASSYPSNLTPINGWLYFSAKDGVHGAELWKSNGTSAGTVLVKDMNPGDASSTPSEFTSMNGSLFFSAFDATHGRELWKSNGTAAGTELVSDIYPGYNAFSPSEVNNSSPTNLTNVNGILFFSAANAYFEPLGYTTNFELWKSDGTATGTVMVKEIKPDTYSSFPGELLSFNGKLFFTADDGESGFELWTSNGTEEGTAMIKDINPGSTGSFPTELTIANGQLYFRAVNTTDDFQPINSELWKSDGTSNGTVMVKEINLDVADSYPQELNHINGRLFFVANDGVHNWELWKSNGTEEGTQLVKNINPETPNLSNIIELINVNGTLYFVANDGKSGFELWKSNGTPTGTTLVKDIYPGPYSSYPIQLTQVNGTLYFEASDGIHGGELWKSDGTEAGTVLVHDIYPGTYGSYASFMTNVNGIVFFNALHPNYGYELWRSDGTTVGTQLVRDINPGYESSYPTTLVNLNGTLYFAATDDTHGREVWKSNGTAVGTTLVADINPDGDGAPFQLTAYNGQLYFSANDNPEAYSFQLWKSDGTAAGTHLLKDVGFGGYETGPINIAVANELLFFIANGAELWKSNGTEEGTVLVRTITPDAGCGYPYSCFPHALTNVNGTVFFYAEDPILGSELWKSDGTEAGTVIVKDIYLGNGSSLPDLEKYPFVELINIDGILYFTANDETHRQELWRSDGTEAGTQLVQDIYPGMASANPRNLTNVNGVLFFAAEHEIYGQALWKYTPPACQATGTMLREVWNHVGGKTIADIPLNKAPSYTEEITSFQGPSNVANQYAARYRGYLCAPESGSYTFWVISDNESELYLSRDIDPANKIKIAYLYGAHVYFGQWEKYPSQKAVPLQLEAGKRYYVEAFHKEGAGSDKLIVGWRKPSARPTAMPVVVPGSVLSPFASGTARIAQEEVEPELLGLTLSAKPNPFRENVHIRFTAVETGPATLTLYDVRGAHIHSLFAGAVQAGETQSIEMKGTNLAKGIYVLKVNNGQETAFQRLVLVE